MSSFPSLTAPTARLSTDPLSAQPRAAAAGTDTSSSSTTSGTEAVSSTFLSLLVQELQNQDPTAPMDSTAMVGQMISLNQLNQLTSINQTLSTQFGSSTPSAGAAGSSTNPTTKVSQDAAHQASTSAVQAALQQLNNGAATSSTLPFVSTSAF